MAGLSLRVRMNANHNLWVLTHRELTMDYAQRMHESALAETERAIQARYNTIAEKRAEAEAVAASEPAEGWDMDCYE